jgi:hypothetical protein
VQDIWLGEILVPCERGIWTGWCNIRAFHSSPSRDIYGQHWICVAISGVSGVIEGILQRDTMNIWILFSVYIAFDTSVVLNCQYGTAPLFTFPHHVNAKRQLYG